MGIEATGKLHAIFETKQVSERFAKREFVVEMADNPKYPQLVIFQLTGDRCAQLDGLNVGDDVRIEFSLRGREWRSPSGEVKYFNSLDVWTLEPARAGAGASGSARREAPRGRPAPARAGGPVDARDDIPPPRDDDHRRDDGPDRDDLPF